MLLAGRQEGTQSVKTSASKPLRMSVNVSWCSVAPGTPWTTLPAYLNKDMKRFGVFFEDCEDKIAWRLRIKGATG